MTPDDQLKNWVEGRPIHNFTRDECCPDFSCCNPENLAPKEDRIRFKKAYDEGRIDIIEGMLMMFLSGALAKSGLDQETYIGGFGHA